MIVYRDDCEVRSRALMSKKVIYQDLPDDVTLLDDPALF